MAELLQRHVEQLLDQPEAGPLRGQWLFALAARLEKPIHADVSAAFRALLRKCCVLRAALAAAASDGEAAAGAAARHSPALARLNVLIVVAGAYFGQDEQLSQLVDCELA